MLLEKEKSCLVVVDVQEKLMPHIQQTAEIEARCVWLMKLANLLNVPCLVSEQYPKGLGPTIASLKQCMPAETDIAKVHFSCYRDPCFLKHWKMLKRRQVVLIGIETHVCVLQTALDMNAAGIDVFVVTDAIGSRYLQDHEYALMRMNHAGVNIVTSEMVLFEWLEHAGDEMFKTVSQAFLR